MDEKEIDSLFKAVAKGSAQEHKDSRTVFGALIKSTLKYRDQMLEQKGIRITVEDVQEALDWLIPCLATGKMPKTENETRLNLLKIWLDELRPFGNLLS